MKIETLQFLNDEIWNFVNTHSISIEREDVIKPQVHGSTDVVIKDIVPTGSCEFN